jgi:UDPglucose 6-dehydrogenase
MKIGVIGLGMVGEAVAYGLRRIGHEVIGYDIDPSKASHAFKDVLKTELIFLCVPTPAKVDGSCDISAVTRVIYDLTHWQFQGLAVIKSTVSPGTTEYLRNEFVFRRLAFCPEFLRERAKFSDFVENHELCIAGVFADVDADLIREAHGNLPKHFVVMSPTEAELAKYFVNCFNAYRVNFANAFYDVCQAVGADYATIKDAVTKRSGITPDYLTCNAQTREFGGACLPKDTLAFAAFVNALNLYTGLFRHIVTENERVKRGLVTNKDTNIAAGNCAA